MQKISTREQRNRNLRNQIKIQQLIRQAQIYTQQLKQNYSNLNIKQPELFINKQLKDFQLIGLNWLINMNNLKINGILADEMGCGKTIQTIALLTYLKQQQKNLLKPSLIVVPLSTIDNWLQELNECYPQAKIIGLYATKEQRLKTIQQIRQQKNFDVIITSYETINIEKYLRQIEFEYIIIDEAHRIKNNECLLSINLRKLKCYNKLLLTGTPLQNNIQELWSLLNYLMQDLFNDKQLFVNYINHIEKDQISDNEQEKKKLQVINDLQNIIRPFMLRRTKKEVLKELSDKQENVIYCGLTQMQIKEYLNVLQGYNQIQSKVVSNNKLMQLRKICQHPYLINDVEDENLSTYGDHLIFNSGKMQILEQLIQKFKNRKILIFSQFKILLDILQDYCDFKNYQYNRLDGDCNYQERVQQIKQFNQNEQSFIFLLSTRAGGLGINLQTADTVILFDSDWNPQVDLQAIGRAHRIGQKNKVQIYRLIAENTIEEKIYERSIIKLKLNLLMVQSINQDLVLTKEQLNQLITYKADVIFKNQQGSMNNNLDQILIKSQQQELLQQQKIDSMIKGVNILQVQDKSINLEQHFMNEFLKQKEEEIKAIQAIQQQKIQNNDKSRNYQDNQSSTLSSVYLQKILQEKTIKNQFKQLYPENHLYAPKLYQLYLLSQGYVKMNQQNYVQNEVKPSQQQDYQQKIRKLVNESFNNWNLNETLLLFQLLENNYLEDNYQIIQNVQQNYYQLQQIKDYWNQCIIFNNENKFDNKQLKQQFQKSIKYQEKIKEQNEIQLAFINFLQNDYDMLQFQNAYNINKIFCFPFISLTQLIKHVCEVGLSKQIQSILLQSNLSAILQNIYSNIYVYYTLNEIYQINLESDIIFEFFNIYLISDIELQYSKITIGLLHSYFFISTILQLQYHNKFYLHYLHFIITLFQQIYIYIRKIKQIIQIKKLQNCKQI